MNPRGPGEMGAEGVTSIFSDAREYFCIAHSVNQLKSNTQSSVYAKSVSHTEYFMETRFKETFIVQFINEPLTEKWEVSARDLVTYCDVRLEAVAVELEVVWEVALEAVLEAVLEAALAAALAVVLAEVTAVSEIHQSQHQSKHFFQRQILATNRTRTFPRSLSASTSGLCLEPLPVTTVRVVPVKVPRAFRGCVYPPMLPRPVPGPQSRALPVRERVPVPVGVTTPYPMVVQRPVPVVVPVPRPIVMGGGGRGDEFDFERGHDSLGGGLGGGHGGGLGGGFGGGHGCCGEVAEATLAAGAVIGGRVTGGATSNRIDNAGEESRGTRAFLWDRRGTARSLVSEVARRRIVSEVAEETCIRGSEEETCIRGRNEPLIWCWPPPNARASHIAARLLKRLCLGKCDSFKNLSVDILTLLCKCFQHRKVFEKVFEIKINRLHDNRSHLFGTLPCPTNVIKNTLRLKKKNEVKGAGRVVVLPGQPGEHLTCRARSGQRRGARRSCLVKTSQDHSRWLSRHGRHTPWRPTATECSIPVQHTPPDAHIGSSKDEWQSSSSECGVSYTSSFKSPKQKSHKVSDQISMNVVWLLGREERNLVNSLLGSFGGGENGRRMRVESWRSARLGWLVGESLNGLVDRWRSSAAPCSLFPIGAARRGTSELFKDRRDRAESRQVNPTHLDLFSPVSLDASSRCRKGPLSSSYCRCKRTPLSPVRGLWPRPPAVASAPRGTERRAARPPRPGCRERNGAARLDAREGEGGAESVRERSRDSRLKSASRRWPRQSARSRPAAATAPLSLHHETRAAGECSRVASDASRLALVTGCCEDRKTTTCSNFLAVEKQGIREGGGGTERAEVVTCALKARSSASPVAATAPLSTMRPALLVRVLKTFSSILSDTMAWVQQDTVSLEINKSETDEYNPLTIGKYLKAVAVPVVRPRPVPVEVPQPYPVTVARPVPVPVARPVAVPQRVAVPVGVPAPYPVVVPQPVPVAVARPVAVPVAQPVVVAQPVLVSEPAHFDPARVILFCHAPPPPATPPHAPTRLPRAAHPSSHLARRARGAGGEACATFLDAERPRQKSQ
ncbi:Uncharacterized protein GBIM_12706 [Gryllus bimaculatus]|nr:Uncharacterized protein GBIM_12706 [Gryllus bimaculatus]